LRVQFELPAGFEHLAFHLLGLKNSSKLPVAGSIDRLLAVSPFVSEQCLRQLGQQGKGNILISRPEELDQIPAATLNTFAQLYQISPAANPEDVDGADGTPTCAPLVGLHGKLYVAEAGHVARIWTGSANATDAAFDRNVEFLVELVGNKQQFGIDTLLAFQSNEVSFRNLLEPFIAPSEPIVIDNAWEKLADLAKRQLLKFQLTAHVLPITDSDQYCLQLRLEGEQPLEFGLGISVRCCPMTRRDLATTLNAQTGSSVEFKPLTCQVLTSFFAFEVWADEGKQKLSAFLLNVPLAGLPANRRQQILRSLLQDKQQVLKLLLFLLTDGKADGCDLLAAIGTAAAEAGQAGSSSASKSSPFLFPLFEAMVRALDRNPTKLDHIARLVKDLRQSSPEEQLLPDNFDDIWQPIYTARQRLKP
jgi:hypothetical protein